ncbi:MBL fold metallo-hydrolase [Arcticibacter tournemirensis]|uniref:MBL fold metallo-hydrolase n=1 Tax=Arcticibacter tournemirensis TaxID=699437 RepID=A0A4Q0MCE0_9SPHI|nr:MBL fold metallo-hydrolase [Arcticibacter tournemirensis]RXF71001.1 MBL fold metallo-hydrolase [Arcticibacter tournemirensis]
MNLYSINTGLFKLDGGAMFGVVPKTIWSKTNPADENNLCTLAMRCLLVEEGNRLILIDTGIGDKQSEKFFRYYYLHGEDTLEKSLKQHGFHRDDITDVFLTHLHLDHVGGAVVRDGQDLVPAFKNAVYWTSKRHWDWAANPNEREKASFLAENITPLQESGKLNFISESDATSLLPDFRIRFTYGHTESMMLPTLQYQDRTVVFVADLLPTTGHIPVPYVAGYDVFPLQSMAEKRAFLDEAQQNNYILFFEHDAVHECCTLQQTEKGIRLADTFSLKEIFGR